MQRMEKIRCGHRLLRFIAEPQLRHAPVHAVYRIDASGPGWIRVTRSMDLVYAIKLSPT